MIPDRAPSQEFVAGGSATQFDYAFPTPDTANVHVAINGVEQTSGFTVSSASTGSGFVTFDVAPAAGSTITVWRTTPIKQTREFGTGSAFYPKQVQKALDDVTMILQEVRGGKVAGAGVPYASEAGYASAAGTADTARTAETATTAVTAAGLASGVIVDSANAAAVASSCQTAVTAENLVQSAINAIVSSATESVNITSVAEAGIASGLTEAAASSLIAGSASEATVASGLIAGAKTDIVNSATKYKGPFKVEYSSGMYRVYDASNVLDYDNASYAGHIYYDGLSTADGFGITKSSFSIPSDSPQGKIYFMAYLNSQGALNTKFGTLQQCNDYVSSAGLIDTQRYLVELAHFSQGGGVTRQVQFGNIVLPGLLPKVSSGLVVNYQGYISLKEAGVGSLGGVKITSNINEYVGSTFWVPCASAVSSFVSGYVDSKVLDAYSGWTVSYAGWASSAGGLDATAMSAVVNSAAAAVNITSVASAATAGGLDQLAAALLISSASATITSVASAGHATLAGGLDAGVASFLTVGSASSAGQAVSANSASFATNATIAQTATTAASAISAGSADTADVASSVTAICKEDIIASAVTSAIASGAGSGGNVVVAGGYAGPFAVSVSGGSIVVAGGRMYLGGVEQSIGSATLTSSNGTVYYYVYYSSGSYYSGCSLAASALALAANIRGSQGFYTALANVSGGVVTQYHYGDIRIDGRVS